MSDAPDPLGKRALFWAPAERREGGPGSGHEDVVPGKHALFSDAPAVRNRSTGAERSSSVPPLSGAQGKAGHPSNRPMAGDHRAARSGRAEAEQRRITTPDELERPPGSGMFGTLTLRCSSCRVESQVDLLEFIVLHLPLWLWRPGRGYTQFMSCPACRRRTWVSASWVSTSR